MRYREKIFTKFNHAIRRVKIGTKLTFHELGDFHSFSDMFCEEALAAYIKRWKDSFNAGDHYAFFLGDIFNDMRKTDQMRLDTLKVAGTDFRKLVQLFMEEAESLAKRLEFLKGCTFSGVQGNHSAWLDHLNISIDEFFLNILKAKYGGAVSVNIVRVFTTTNRYVDLKFLLFHGKTATMYIGSNLNELERAANKFPDMHVVFAGHAHQQITAPVAKIFSEYKEDIKQHETHLIRCGSFQKNFLEDHGNYATESMLRPSVLRMPRVEVTIEQEIHNNQKVIVPYIEVCS